MRLTLWALFFVLFFPEAFLHAECVNDHRSNKKAGILITDFTITGTQTISATDLSRITSDMIGSCFDEDSDEMGERVRASFQRTDHPSLAGIAVEVFPRRKRDFQRTLPLQACTEGLRRLLPPRLLV